jgi:Ca-activated chloride channel family protein
MFARMFAVGLLSAVCADAQTRVSLHVTVTTRNGFVFGLPREAFEVRVDGKPQTIESFQFENMPASIGLLIDDSGSARLLLPHFIAIAREFLEILDDRDEVFLAKFNKEFYVLQEFTRDRRAVMGSLSKGMLTGSTAIMDALEAATRYMLAGAGYRNQAIIVLSDGDDNLSTGNLSRRARILAEAGVPVYSLALLSSRDLDGDLKGFTGATGGVYFRSDRPAELSLRAHQVADAIHGHYHFRFLASAPLKPVQVRVALKGAQTHVSRVIE